MLQRSQNSTIYPAQGSRKDTLVQADFWKTCVSLCVRFCRSLKDGSVLTDWFETSADLANQSVQLLSVLWLLAFLIYTFCVTVGQSGHQDANQTSVGSPEFLTITFCMICHSNSDITPV